AAQQVAQIETGLTLAFTASDRSWLSIQSDDKPPAQTLIIQPGETREFKALSKLKVTVGNLLGVQVKINGKPAKLPTKDGLSAINPFISKENSTAFIEAPKNPNTNPQKTEAAPKSTTPTSGSVPGQNAAGISNPPSNTGAALVKKPAGKPGLTATPTVKSTVT